MRSHNSRLKARKITWSQLMKENRWRKVYIPQFRISKYSLNLVIPLLNKVVISNSIRTLGRIQQWGTLTISYSKETQWLAIILTLSGMGLRLKISHQSSALINTALQGSECLMRMNSPMVTKNLHSRSNHFRLLQRSCQPILRMMIKRPKMKLKSRSSPIITWSKQV